MQEVGIDRDIVNVVISKRKVYINDSNKIDHSKSKISFELN